MAAVLLDADIISFGLEGDVPCRSIGAPAAGSARIVISVSW